MDTKRSKRLAGIVNALQLKNNPRILEIGCGPGAMAREISRQIGNGHILAIQQAISASQAEIKKGSLSYRQVAIANFSVENNEKPFDIAIAVSVGALDGRHPEIEKQSLLNIAKALTTEGKLFMGKEISLNEYK